jgi:hypothetical protein
LLLEPFPLRGAIAFFAVSTPQRAFAQSSAGVKLGLRAMTAQARSSGLLRVPALAPPDLEESRLPALPGVSAGLSKLRISAISVGAMS